MPNSTDTPAPPAPLDAVVRRFWTWGEMEASQILGGMNPNEAGHRIIALAERIKSERAVVAMTS